MASPAQAKELARGLVRDIRDPRVQHAIEVGFWEEGNPLVWVIGDLEPLRSFSRRAVALCGDAAHPMIPVVAQGANQSFEDAWRLALHLRVPAALDRYSHERASHVARIQKEARRRTLPVMSIGSRYSDRLYTSVLRRLPSGSSTATMSTCWPTQSPTPPARSSGYNEGTVPR